VRVLLNGEVVGQALLIDALQPLFARARAADASR
jgi:hypothetical protein